jgi:ESAT-6 family protein
MTQHQMGRGAGTLIRAATLVGEARADLEALGRRLEGQVIAVEAHWIGAGGRAFQAVQAAWNDHQRLIVGALVGLERSLRATEHDFTSADDQQSARHSALQRRIG